MAGGPDARVEAQVHGPHALPTSGQALPGLKQLFLDQDPGAASGRRGQLLAYPAHSASGAGRLCGRSASSPQPAGGQAALSRQASSRLPDRSQTPNPQVRPSRPCCCAGARCAAPRAEFDAVDVGMQLPQTLHGLTATSLPHIDLAAVASIVEMRQISAAARGDLPPNETGSVHDPQ